MCSPSQTKETYLSDTNDHVVDVGLDGGDRTGLSVGTIPHLDANILALLLLSRHVNNLDVEGDVREVLEVLTSGARNGDLSSLDLDSDYKNKKVRVSVLRGRRMMNARVSRCRLRSKTKLSGSLDLRSNRDVDSGLNIINCFTYRRQGFSGNPP